MRTLKTLLCAVAVTVVSVIALTFLKGMPTPSALAAGSLSMFIVAFIVLQFLGE